MHAGTSWSMKLSTVSARTTSVSSWFHSTTMFTKKDCLSWMVFKKRRIKCDIGGQNSKSERGNDSFLFLLRVIKFLKIGV